jgi:hypothetical protein
MEQTNEDHAIAVATRLARQVFHKRGNRSEAHLTEAELVALMALAIRRSRERVPCR